MKQLLQKVQNYICEHNLLDGNQKVLVGTSGGADSMALLHILRALDYECVAAHCNFHLRAEESDRDERFVEKYCADNGIEYHSVSFDTYGYMKEKAISLEMVARELRYNWFEQLSEKLNIQKVAVAHHQDDSVETVLINMTRGCGIRGLTGIPSKNEKTVRPLLCLSREEIIDYLLSQNIQYIDDSTNAEDIYVRNKIRLKVIPLLEEINPALKQSISRMSGYLSDVERIYTSYISEKTKLIFDGEKIDIQKLFDLPEPQTVLFETLQAFGFNSQSVNDILNAKDSLSGKVFYSDNYRLVKDRNYYILQEKQKDDDVKLASCYTINSECIDTPIKMSIESIGKDESFVLNESKSILYVDKAKLSFPLHIRKWKQGDRFKPLGMTGSKKLSDYFGDRKFSLPQKENTWLLCTANDEIIWVIGERSDNRFRISGNTREMLKIEIYT